MLLSVCREIKSLEIFEDVRRKGILTRYCLRKVLNTTRSIELVAILRKCCRRTLCDVCKSSWSVVIRACLSALAVTTGSRHSFSLERP